MTQADDLCRAVADLFETSSITIDRPEVGHIRLRGRFLCQLSTCYDELRRRFEQLGFTPFVRGEQDDVDLIAAPVIFNPPASRWTINLVLLLATILSTLWIGALMETEIRGLKGIPGLGDLWLGLPYCLSLMTILGAHELGHYFAACPTSFLCRFPLSAHWALSSASKRPWPTSEPCSTLALPAPWLASCSPSRY
jgi:hypothetical protein